jgi:hypothetical protein
MSNEPIFSVLTGKPSNLIEITSGRHTDYAGYGTAESPWTLAGPLGACGSGPNQNSEWMTTFTTLDAGVFSISGTDVEVWCGDSSQSLQIQENGVTKHSIEAPEFGSTPSFSVNIKFRAGDVIRFGGNNVKVSNLSAYASPVSDPLYGDVRLLIPFDGIGTTAQDFSPYESSLSLNAIINLGDGEFVEIARTQGSVTKFGQALEVDAEAGYGGGYCQTTGFILPSLFTIECWFQTAQVSTSQCYLFTQFSGYLRNIRLWQDGPAIKVSDNAGSLLINSGSVLSANTWVHVALVRDAGDLLRLYIDGQQVGTATSSGSWDGVNSGFVRILLQVTTSASTNALRYVDDYRVTFACRYPDGSSFTPPTAALPK